MTDSIWPNSADLWSRTRRSLPGGVSTGLRASMKPHPIFFERGEGARLFDVDGNAYSDYVLGWGPVIVGHAHPVLTAAVTAQLSRGVTYGSGHRLEAEAAEAVLERIPGMERVLWTNTGSEADQIALRLARGATGRRRFVKFRGHYHGWSDPFLVGYRPGANGSFGLGSQGQNPAALDDVVLVDWGDADALAAVLADATSDVAAVFLEPVLVNSGVLPAPDGFLQRVRDLCDSAGTLLVFDEVITGFRIARGGAVERFGVTPDMVVLAKAIAGGFPLAAVAGTAAVLDHATSGVVHAGTYNGNPLVLAAALATLEILDAPNVYADFERRGAVLAAGLRAAFASQGVPAVTHQVGPVVQILPGLEQADTFEEFLGLDVRAYDAFVVEMLKRGQFLLPGGRLYLSTEHTDALVDDTIAAAGEAAAAVAEHLSVLR